MGELVLRMVMSLAVVMGLLLLAIRFAGRKYRTNSAATVSVLHRQALTRGSGVTVVQVGQRVLVLGTTEQQVRVLAEMDPSELAAPAEPAHTYADSAQAEVGPTPSFADSTRHRAELRAVPAPEAPPEAAPVPTPAPTPVRAPSSIVSKQAGEMPYADFAAALLAELSGEPAPTPAPAPPAGRVKPVRPGKHRAPVAELPTPSGPPVAAPKEGRLSGSLLSPHTWRQARAAVGRRAS